MIAEPTRWIGTASINGNNLKRANHGSILTGTRQGWYEFTEKMIRGYVRLKAEQEQLVLEADHPGVKHRTRGLSLPN